jgi:flagellar motor switch protein FliM
MADNILDKEEIDALLGAVKEKGVDGVTPEKEKPSVQAESGLREEVNLFPMAKAHTLTKELQNSLALIFDAFSHKGSSTLTTTLRTHVSFSLEEMEQSTYEEFIQTLPEPSSLWYLGMKPHDLHIAVCLEPKLVHSIISVLMGGGNAAGLKSGSNVTELEQSVIESVVTAFCRELKHAWSRLLEVEIEIDNRETRPRLLQIYPPKEVTVIVNMLMKVGDTEGAIFWGIPDSILKILQARISHKSQMETREKLHQVAERLRQRVLSIPTQIEACLSETPVAVTELLDLSPGDVLKLEHQIGESVGVLLNGTRKFSGQVLVSGNRRAVRIV